MRADTVASPAMNAWLDAHPAVTVPLGLVCAAVLIWAVMAQRRWFADPVRYSRQVSAVVGAWAHGRFSLGPRALNRALRPLMWTSVPVAALLAMEPSLFLAQRRGLITTRVVLVVIVPLLLAVALGLVTAMVVGVLGRPSWMLLCAPRTATDREVLEALRLVAPRGRRGQADGGGAESPDPVPPG